VQNRPGRMAPLEASIHHELNYYLARMFGEPEAASSVKIETSGVVPAVAQGGRV